MALIADSHKKPSHDMAQPSHEMVSRARPIQRLLPVFLDAWAGSGRIETRPDFIPTAGGFKLSPSRESPMRGWAIGR